MKKLLSILATIVMFPLTVFAVQYTVPMVATTTTPGSVMPYFNLQYWPISAPYFVATSTTATSTFAGGITGPGSFTVQSGSGNVGVGITAPAESLDILGNMHVSAGGYIQFGTNSTHTRILDDASGLRTAILSRSGQLDILNQTGGSFGSMRVSKISGNSSASQNLTLDSTTNATKGFVLINPSGGNVGIGTTAPKSLLSIYDPSGKTTLGSSTALLIAGKGTGSFVGERLELNFKSWDNEPNTAGTIGFITTDNANNEKGDLYFAVKSSNGNVLPTEAMRIASGGNIGIGTSTPLAKLDVLNTLGGSAPLFSVASSTNGTGTSTALYVAANGNVGVGTAFPAAKFDVNGTASASFVVAANYVRAGTTAQIWWNNRSAMFSPADGLIELTNVAATDFTRLQFGGTTSSFPSLQVSTSTSANGVALRVIGADGVGASNLLVSGNVGVGTTSPATSLDVNGTITQSTVKSCSLGLTTDSLGSITGCVASDEKLKTNISSLTDGNPILKLNPVFYNWKDKSKDDQIHSGFIAQQVEKVMPQAVVSAGTNTKGVDSNAILSYVVKFIQGFYADFQKLIVRVSGLEQKLNAQQKQIDAMQLQINQLKK